MNIAEETVKFLQNGGLRKVEPTKNDEKLRQNNNQLSGKAGEVLKKFEGKRSNRQQDNNS